MTRLLISIVIIVSMAWPAESDARQPLPVHYKDLYWLNYHEHNEPHHHIGLEERLAAFQAGEYIAVHSEQRKPWPLALPVQWNADPFKDSDWRSQLNAWRLIEPSLQKYEATRQPFFLLQTLPYIADWYDFNVVKDGVNRYKWYDAATGIRALRLAYILMAVARDGIRLGKQDAKVLRTLASLHTANLTNPTNIVPNNHAFFQLHGAMALCRAAPDSKGCAHGGTRRVRHRFADMLQKQFGTEGMHMEHSPAYHFFVFEVARRFLASGWYKGVPELDRVTEKILANAPWLIDPTGHTIEVGDSTSSVRDIGMRPLPSGPHACEREGTYRPECYGSRMFGEAGYAVARSLPPIKPSDSSLFFMVGAFHSKAHRHADDLGIVWMEDGQWILSDTGRYSYGEGERRAYSRSTRAHSTVEVDDTSYTLDPKFAYGSAIKGVTQTAWGFDILGSVWHQDLGVFHARRVLYRPKEWLVVIDRLKSQPEKSRTWTAWFNFEPGLSIRESENEVLGTVAGKPIRLQSASTFADCAGFLVEGQTQPRLQGWKAQDYRNLIPRPARGFRCTGTDGVMVHVFTLGHTADVKKNGDGFAISIDGKPLPLSLEVTPAASHAAQ